MKLGPALEALVHGAVDGTLTEEEREAFDRLLAENADVRSRYLEVTRLSTLLDSLESPDPPPTLAKDVLAEIARSADVESSASPERSRGARLQPQARLVFSNAPSHLGRPHPRGIAMNKKIVWGLAAAAVLVLAVFSFTAYPPADEGTQATIGAAQRYQAPQIEAKDVKVGDTSTQPLFQSETWDAIVKNEALRTSLQDPEVRAALASPELLAALRQESVVRAIGQGHLVRRLNDPDLVRSLRDNELIRRIAEADLRAALSVDAFAALVRNDLMRAWLTRPGVAVALASADLQKALLDPGLSAALKIPQFGVSLARGGGCDEWGCGANSPIVNGAVLR